MWLESHVRRDYDGFWDEKSWFNDLLSEMEFKKDHEAFFSQNKYAKGILKKFKLEECKEMIITMMQKEKHCKEDGTKKINQTF